MRRYLIDKFLNDHPDIANNKNLRIGHGGEDSPPLDPKEYAKWAIGMASWVDPESFIKYSEEE